MQYTVQQITSIIYTLFLSNADGASLNELHITFHAVTITL
jgi:hypothetical protein